MAEVLVCKDGEIADGGVRVITAGEVEIGVIRQGGKYYAYRNHCPHQGGPVCEGVRMPQVLDVIAPGPHLPRPGLRPQRHAHYLPVARL